MNLSELYDQILELNAELAPGSECNELQDFVADCYERFGLGPWEDKAENTEVPGDMLDYYFNPLDS